MDEVESTTTVLVVDDDRDVREAMVDVLESEGYRVLTANNGARAIEQLRKGPKPDAVLVDLHMPIMDGARFCDACLADPELREIPRLIVSSDPFAAAEITKYGGAAGFVSKPLSVNALIAKLQWLKRTGARAA